MIACQKDLFRIPSDVTYLNCAYMSPQLRTVSEAGMTGLAAKERPWQVTPADFFNTSEAVRALFAQIISAHSDDIAIIPSASYGIAVASANIASQAGKRIIVLQDQFPSNVYPWMARVAQSGEELVTLDTPSDDDWTRALLAHIDDRCAIVAVANCHWTDGGLIDVARIGDRCREVGAALVLDLTQSAGAMPFDVAIVKPDFVICAGYKWLCGPYSLGFLYADPAYHSGTPIEHNWIARSGSEDFAGLVNYREQFQPGARRYDVGERSNFVLMPMAQAALEQITAWQVPEIAATLRGLTAMIAKGARELGLRTAPDHLRVGHMLGLRFDAGVPESLLKLLASEKIYISTRGNAIRISPHLYNDTADVDKLLATLAQATNRL